MRRKQNKQFITKFTNWIWKFLKNMPNIKQTIEWCVIDELRF